MKYIYIAGLEHSGTTLTDFLLSQRPGAIGLGEIASFFRPEHMRQYMAKWGEYEDVNRCSCNRDWQHCEIWQHLDGLNGLNSNAPLIDKYRALIDVIRRNFGNDRVIIDSSKSLENFKMLEKGIADLDLDIKDILIVFTLKDVRGFAMSMLRKNSKMSFFSILRTFNWWLASNQSWLAYLEQSPYSSSINLYENLCAAPARFAHETMAIAGSSESAVPGISHIAMGNKSFALRNSDHVTYDDAWQSSFKIRLAYALHFPARRFNTSLHKRGR